MFINFLLYFTQWDPSKNCI